MQASKVISGFRSAAIGCWGINSSHISPLIDPSDQCIGSNFLGNAIQDNLGFRHLRQSCWWYLICVVGLLVKINCIYSKIIHWRTFSHFPMLTEVHKKRWPSNTHLETHQHYNSEKPTCIHFYNTVEIYFGGHLTLWVGKLHTSEMSYVRVMDCIVQTWDGVVVCTIVLLQFQSSLSWFIYYSMYHQYSTVYVDLLYLGFLFM